MKFTSTVILALALTAVVYAQDAAPPAEAQPQEAAAEVPADAPQATETNEFQDPAQTGAEAANFQGVDLSKAKDCNRGDLNCIITKSNIGMQNAGILQVCIGQFPDAKADDDRFKQCVYDQLGANGNNNQQQQQYGQQQQQYNQQGQQYNQQQGSETGYDPKYNNQYNQNQQNNQAQTGVRPQYGNNYRYSSASTLESHTGLLLVGTVAILSLGGLVRL
ncbi:hypothetical protein H4R33_005897 [Dimargaris cristalligena]|uniref:Uncharacterized protein n=1 Tax=Dimargaris cristalligena TaxID=215637 RepID=A0A4P9ZT76_9FUNG|nr:hypothetical protein H4R33_005897 [Dimargaris cristalligena]RKP35720.1 hypothetical protein BJ085DRAFT_31731 [Dimargaris cristalligena]|eukprot:RKP35720.1 hypothetical protein BJ085DRAFT_31731 [Dimargaris cristalligena]